MQFTFACFALILSCIGYLPYIGDILRGRVRPHRITWAIWTILTTIAAVNQILNEGGYSSLFFIASALCVTIIFVLSFHYGVGGASAIDRFCLCAAFLLLGYWLILQDTRTSTLLVVFIDVIAALPTILKTYRLPKTETYPQWILAVMSGACTLLAVPKGDWVLFVYPSYVVLVNGTVVVTKFFSERLVKTV
jgi:hypothetical protein